MSLMPTITGDTSGGGFGIFTLYAIGPIAVWDGKSPLPVKAGSGVILQATFIALKPGTFNATLRLEALGFMPSQTALTAQVADVALYVPFDPVTLFQGTSADSPILVADLSTSDETLSFQIPNLPKGVSFKLLPKDPLPAKAGAGNFVAGTLQYKAAANAATGVNLPINLTAQFKTGTAKPFARALTVLKKPSPARSWNVTGPGDHGTPLDGVIKNYMQGNNVRACALAVVKGTKLVFAHGYTWGEASYPVTQPTTLFRLASCSKPLTAIAITRVVESVPPGAELPWSLSAGRHAAAA
jgi:Beta-lactamase